MLATKRRAVSVMNQEVFLQLFRKQEFMTKTGRFSMRTNQAISKSMEKMKMALFRLGSILNKIKSKPKKDCLNFSRGELRNGLN